ncbi:MAG: SAM-dependent methyltransferase [Candidatus Methanofastidiosia archaeon]|jgi:methyltransferase (TIGR00027 family)
MKSDILVQEVMNLAFLRAMESYHLKKDRLFEDQFARGFLKFSWRAILELLRLPGVESLFLALGERQAPGVTGGLLCRIRYMDDTLSDALKEGLDQVVILGAGSDTRALRMPDIDTVQVFEVDHPAPQDWKKKCLKKMFGTLPPHITFIPMDFDRQTLEDEMAIAGFRTGARTFVICEGVTQYITAETNDAIFQFVSKAAPGSRIVFSYVNSGVIDGSFEDAEKWKSLMQSEGLSWIFGIDPGELDQYLSARGFTLLDHVGASDYQERYLNPRGRHLNIMEIERVALAEVTGT